MNNITNTSVKGINDFSKELDRFIKEVSKNLVDLYRMHQGMNSNWKGDQYDRFSEYIQKTIKDAQKQLSDLNDLRKEIDKRARELEDILKIRVPDGR